jgi:hypothetical protein
MAVKMSEVLDFGASGAKFADAEGCRIGVESWEGAE